MASTDQHTGVRFPWVRTAQSADADSEEAATEATASRADELGQSSEFDAGSVPENRNASPGGRPAVPSPAAWSPAVAPAHKPSRFLGELVRAMLAAAQEARAAAVEQVHTDAKSHIEAIHARSADRAAELKREADEDNATTREWSKAEMARIREQTEQRIAGRKEELAADLERHAARIEAEIDQVQQRIAAFEQEVEAFFARLAGATDPTQLAMLAEQMPEPPQFDDLVSSAATGSVGADSGAADEPNPGTADEPGAGATDTLTEESAQATLPRAGEAAEEASPETGPVEPAALEDAIEPAAALAPEEAGESVAAALDRVAAPESETAPVEPGATDEEASGTEAPGAAEAELTSAADAERQATIEATSESEDTVSETANAAGTAEFDDAGPAARLASLMQALPRPGEMGGAGQRGGEPSGPSINSIVAVVGLVSVAGIASFKRQLAHVPGVFSVGVSSSPDGEFVFRVAHDPDVVLRDVVPTLPGFAARVIKRSDGRLSISAHDPTNDA